MVRLQASGYVLDSNTMSLPIFLMKNGDMYDIVTQLFLGCEKEVEELSPNVFKGALGHHYNLKIKSKLKVTEEHVRVKVTSKERY